MRPEDLTTVSPWPFPEERDAVTAVVDRVDGEVWSHAWANFWFLDPAGHCHHVDLLLAGPCGLRLLDVVMCGGEVQAGGPVWTFGTVRSRTTMDDPLERARDRAAALGRTLRPSGDVSVRAAVVLCGARSVTGAGPVAVVPRPAGGPPLLMLGEPLVPGVSGSCPRLARGGDDHPTAVSAVAARLSAGIVLPTVPGSGAAGPWRFTGGQLDASAHWQDYLAWSTRADKVRRRVRVFPLPATTTAAQRARAEERAHREHLMTVGLDHPGVLRIESVERHPHGPALVLDHGPGWTRLDHWLAATAVAPGTPAAVGVFRQILDVLAHAHARGVHHGGLAARAVMTFPRAGSDVLGPHVRVGGWDAWARRCTADPKSGTADPKSGTADPKSGTGSPKTRTARPAPGPGGLEAGGTGPDDAQARSADLGALRELAVRLLPPSCVELIDAHPAADAGELRRILGPAPEFRPPPGGLGQRPGTATR